MWTRTFLAIVLTSTNFDEMLCFVLVKVTRKKLRVIASTC